MGDFDKALAFVLKCEGYGNKALLGDLGGLTVWGISARAYPGEVAIMSKMTPEAAKGRARVIYFNDYWKPMGCEGMEWPRNLVVFDTAVNCGFSRIKSFMANAKTWQDIVCNRVRWLLYESKSRYRVGLLNRVEELFIVSNREV